MTTLNLMLFTKEIPSQSGGKKIHDTFYHASSSNPEEPAETGMLVRGVYPTDIAEEIFKRFAERNHSIINLKVPCDKSKFPEGFKAWEFKGYTPLLGKWTQEHLGNIFPRHVVINYENGEA